MRIILDANFLVYAARQRIDYLNEFYGKEFVVLSCVVKELTKLSHKGKGKDKESVVLALQILQKNIKNMKIKVLEVDGWADDVIVKIARKEDVVATMDGELKKRLKGKARILRINGKNLEVL